VIHRPVTRVLVLASALFVSCTTRPAESPSPAAGDSAASAPTYNRITAQQLADANLLGVTADIAVQRLRPGYLIDKNAGASQRATPQPIQVSVNGGQLAGLRALSSIPASTIAEIRYFTAGEASQRFRTRTNAPVILVTLMSR
jgi:hypothetical protein